MNVVMISGRICCVPKIRILDINGKAVNICNFTIATVNGIGEDDVHDNTNTDFIECICFNREALAVNANMIKGSKITCTGQIRNYFFEDSNRTKHYTNMLVLSQVEYGDTSSAFDRNTDKKKSVDLSIASNLQDVLSLYDKVRDSGYLCIDEDDYYRIAMAGYC